MSRALCQQCQRPLRACICAFIVKIENHIPVIVLQHPSEVTQSKGTVRLLEQSLTQCQVIVGENFDDCQELKYCLQNYKDNVVLLYPSEQAISLTKLTNTIIKENNIASSQEIEIKCIIVLDGTWKKAYRMFMSNPRLADLRHIVLPEGIASLYQIRKTKKDNALSTLEACCHALSLLENEQDKYKTLLKNFISFNQFQQSFAKHTKSK